MSTKKLGLVCGSDSLGGLEMNLVKLGSWMQLRGWDVFLYLLPESPATTFAKELNLTVRPISKHRKYYDAGKARQLKKRLLADNIDTVIIRDTRDLSLVGITKKMMGNRLQFIYWQAMEIGIPKKDILHTLRFKKLDAWLALLPYLAKQIATQTRFPAERVHIVPLGLELDRFANNEISRENARTDLNIPNGIFTAGIIGRLDPQKGQHTAIEAVTAARANGREINLIILGEPTKNEGNAYAQKLQKMVNDAGMEEHILFRPYMRDTAPFYKAIDTLIMASERETFGTVTIEAMASGTPVIGTDTGGTIEILEEGKLGKLFVPNDADGLLTGLLDLHSDKASASALSADAKQAAISKYAHETVCTNIEAIIAKL